MREFWALTVGFLRSGPAIVVELARLNRNLAELITLLTDLRKIAAHEFHWRIEA